jgi:CxxC motif-containing protein
MWFLSLPAFAPTALPPGTSLPLLQGIPTTAMPTPTTSRPVTSTGPSVPTLPQNCGGGPSTLTSTTGSIQTVGWPNTAYPRNVECTWNIACPAGSKIEIEFENVFRIAGAMPSCPRDSVTITECNGARTHGPFCHLTRPGRFETACSDAKVTFDSNGVRGDTRYGFKMNYVCKSQPTTAPPPTTRPTTVRPTTARPTTPRPTTPRPTTPRPTTLPPTTQPPTTIPTVPSVPTLSQNCGGGPSTLTSTTGSIQTVGWPNTAYPRNVECTWNIACPAGSKIEIEFENVFRIAGAMPSCPRDSVTITECNGARTHGPFCHLTRPGRFETACSDAKVTFDSNGVRGDTRYGFKMNYVCKSQPTVAPPPTTRPTTARPTTPRPTTPRPTTPRPTTPRPTTPAPTTQPPTISSLCGGGPEVRTDGRGRIETLGWSQERAYPINTNCIWKIECPASQRVQLVFSNRFRVAGQMPACTKDQLNIRDCRGGITYGPFCHVSAPAGRTSQCNAVEVEFNAGSGRGSTRSGFRLNYECV